VSVDRITGGVLTVAGIATALEATTFDVAFMTDPVGPKALPMVVAMILVLAGASALLRPREHVGLPSREAAARMVGAVAAFVLYAVALPWIGFFGATSLVILALALLYQGPPIPSAIAALAVSGALWLLFVALLALPLPVGDLWIR
jgi:putative tricarboxylic transport membrane protein